jgi:hypothetical protein
MLPDSITALTGLTEFELQCPALRVPLPAVQKFVFDLVDRGIYTSNSIPELCSARQQQQQQALASAGVQVPAVRHTQQLQRVPERRILSSTMRGSR